MSYPLVDLVNQLSPKSESLGRVITVQGNRVLAATPSGLRTVTAAAGLAVGDRISINSGFAYKAPLATTTIPV